MPNLNAPERGTHNSPPAWVDEPYLAGLLRDVVASEVVGRIRNSFSGRDPAELARRQQGYAILQRSVAKLSAAGAAIILGGDTGLEDNIFGYAEHKELELMVGAGMATAKLATVQHATASKEHSLHDVRLLISEHLDIDARFVTSETHFIYDLGADFLDRIELMIAIEDRFDVEITDDDIEQFQVVGDLISHLARQQNAIGGAKPVP